MATVAVLAVLAWIGEGGLPLLRGAPKSLDPKLVAEEQARRAASDAAAKAKRKEGCRSLDQVKIDEALIQRIDNDNRDFYVTRQWYGMTLDMKQGIARYLYTCRSDEQTAHVFDSRTGKALAQYDSTWGYSNYEK